MDREGVQPVSDWHVAKLVARVCAVLLAALMCAPLAAQDGGDGGNGGSSRGGDRGDGGGRHVNGTPGPPDGSDSGSERNGTVFRDTQAEGGAGQDSPYEELLQKAWSAFRTRHYRSAWDMADSLVELQGDSLAGVRDQARQVLAAIDQKASDLFEEGEKHWWYREYCAAETTYMQIFEQFPHATRFTAARNRLIELRFMPAVASQKRLVAAQAQEAAGKYIEASQQYAEVIAEYPDTVASVEAKKALTALKHDPEKRAGVAAEAQAQLARTLSTKLELALNYLANPPTDAADWTLYDRGVQYLHEIIAAAPDSSQAAQARARLKQETERVEATLHPAGEKNAKPAENTRQP
ncbi:MAG: tetratricopeptide repeat protein [Terriglobales bacterium]